MRAFYVARRCGTVTQVSGHGSTVVGTGFSLSDAASNDY